MNKNKDCYVCYYPNHEVCKNVNYCIFDSNVYELMKRISDLENKLDYYRKILKSIRLGDVYYGLSEKNVTVQITTCKYDLKQLKEFENKVKKGEIKGYGFK